MDQQLCHDWMMVSCLVVRSGRDLAVVQLFKVPDSMSLEDGVLLGD